MGQHGLSEQHPASDWPRLIRSILPASWLIDIAPQWDRSEDGRFRIVAPSGADASFVVEVKSRVEPRDVDRFRGLKSRIAFPHRLLVVAPFLSERTRAMMREDDIAYLDEVGNALIATESMLIDRTSALPEPKAKVKEPRSSLRGASTGRVIRFLTDHRPPFQVRGIASQTKLNAGNVSRVLDFCARESFIVRAEGGVDRGSVLDVRWKPLIERWGRDLARDLIDETLLEPRGLDLMLRKLREGSIRYAVTGSFGSSQLAPVAQPAAIDIYVESIAEARESLGLQPSKRMGNVRLIAAFDPVVFSGTVQTTDGVTLAAPPQIAADCVSRPMRSQDEYLALIAWMEKHESVWR